MNKIPLALSTLSLLMLSSLSTAKDLPGLWMGIVEVTHVNEVHCNADDRNQCTGAEDGTTPKAVKYPFNLQLVLHMDASKKTQLLREVYVMQTKEQVVLGKSGSGENIMGNKRVLVTKDDRLQDFDGIIRRSDNKLAAVRLLSPSFEFPMVKTALNNQESYSFQDTIALDGTISDVATTTVKTKNAMTYEADHPTNPFRHQFHPDHTKGREVQRSFTITISGAVNNDTGKLNGIYEERIVGLHNQALNLKGNIQLTRVNSIVDLNPDKNGGGE